MRKWAFALIPLLATASVSAQTAEDFAAKYQAITAYEIRPGILMIPHFTDFGRVCEVTLEERLSLTPKDETLSSSMSASSLSGILDELAPPPERGAEAKYLLPESFVVGQSSHIARDFQTVVVTEDGTISDGLEIVTIRWKDRPCAATRKK
jgi:hypothetical protein